MGWVHAAARLGLLARDGVFPLAHRADLQAAEGLSPEGLDELTLRRVRDVVFRAFHSVPWYKRVFEELGATPADVRTLSDLAQLPCLRREQVVAHADALSCVGPDRVGAIWNSTGGSTGTPMRFLQSPLSRAMVEANERRTWRLYGLPRGARRALVWGADRDVDPGRDAADWRNRMLGFRGLNAFYMDDERCRAYVEILGEFRPEVVYGYATALHALARFVEANGPLEWAPLAIRSTAERLLPEHRERIERVFRAPVYDYYGGRDAGPVAGQVPGEAGLVVFSDLTHVELLDASGEPVPEGDIGEVVITRLHEHAMPLIRYRTGDLAVRGPRARQLPFPTLQRVEGRVGDVLQTAAGRRVHGEFFTHLFYDAPDVRRFQIVQPDPVSLQVFVEGVLDEARWERVRAACAERMELPQGAVVLRAVDHIEPSASGKHRFVIPFVERR